MTEPTGAAFAWNTGTVTKNTAEDRLVAFMAKCMVNFGPVVVEKAIARYNKLKETME